MKKQMFSPKQNVNSRKLASMWGAFIDWDKRLLTEGPFLLEHLRRHNCRRVFDAALGDGVLSIYLLKNGFDVASNELDAEFRKVALENAKREGVKLVVSDHYWQDLHKHFRENSFDAVVCEGNSLCCEPSSAGRRKAVQNFHFILRQDGMLEIDERNFDYMLRNREEILAGNFRYSGNVIYCGDRIHAVPVKITERKVVMQYTDESNGKRGYFRIYPFKGGELVSLIRSAKFTRVESFSDFKPGFDPNADFYMHIAVK
ncbi:MAG: methyltransferase domain-containing protein [Candidatus Anstonellaceae archaeon]